MTGVAGAPKWARSWAVWRMGVFSRSWMELLVASGLSTYKRAHIVTGKTSAVIAERRCAVAKVRHDE
jgi:hypothetical protein